MAETTQYSFSLRDVAIALIQQHGIREGRWMLGFELNMSIGTFGANDGEPKPGAILQIGKATLVKATDLPQDAPLVVDASTIEPMKSAARRKGKK